MGILAIVSIFYVWHKVFQLQSFGRLLRQISTELLRWLLSSLSWITLRYLWVFYNSFIIFDAFKNIFMNRTDRIGQPKSPRCWKISHYATWIEENIKFTLCRTIFSNSSLQVQNKIITQRSWSFSKFFFESGLICIFNRTWFYNSVCKISQSRLDPSVQKLMPVTIWNLWKQNQEEVPLFYVPLKLTQRLFLGNIIHDFPLLSSGLKSHSKLKFFFHCFSWIALGFVSNSTHHFLIFP